MIFVGGGYEAVWILAITRMDSIPFFRYIVNGSRRQLRFQTPLKLLPRDIVKVVARYLKKEMFSNKCNLLYLSWYAPRIL
jgi:hypothetical protein